MKTLSKQRVPKTQEFPDEERVSVQYLREGGMPFRKIVWQLNFHLSNEL